MTESWERGDPGARWRHRHGAGAGGRTPGGAGRRPAGRPLAAVPRGGTVRLLGVGAGRGLQAHLAAMGLVPGVEMTVLTNHHRGPFVVSVKGCRIMLGRGMAQRIVVE